MTPVDVPPDDTATDGTAAGPGASTASGPDASTPSGPGTSAASYDAVDIMQVLAARRAARRALPLEDWQSLVLTAPAGMATDDAEDADTAPSAVDDTAPVLLTRDETVTALLARDETAEDAEDAERTEDADGTAEDAEHPEDADGTADDTDADDVDDGRDMRPGPALQGEPSDKRRHTVGSPAATPPSVTAADADRPGEAPTGAAPTGATPADATSTDDVPVHATPAGTTSAGGAPGTARALTWLDAATPLTRVDTGSPPAPAHAPLLERAPRRRRRMAPTLIAVGVVVAVIVAYGAAALLWPSDALSPSVTSTPLAPVRAPAAHIAWPQAGAAGVQVSGMGDAVASTTAQSSIASITKLVTALMVLDKLPLKPGEQGPEYHFTFADRQAYWGYLGRNESALNVPAGGELTEYQMLQGMLIASASNYAARMAYDIWPDDDEFGRAATRWLGAHGVTGITITNPTGFTTRNTASPSALLKLAQLALRNPVIAQIVAQKSADLPGAGVIENTNQLLQDDPGVVGVKTGTLVGYDLVAAKDVHVGGTTVRITAVGLNQPSSTVLWASVRSLFSQAELALTPTVVVPAGTAVGEVTTPWGAHATLTAAKDADAVLWDGASATATTSLALGAHRAKGQHAGTVTVTGPVDSAKVSVVLSGTIDPPTAWWRLTHPLQLLGRG